ncbi:MULTISPECIES: gamma carbonic anhydrase family protein [Aneurinibacillus]|jgi:carbonic anhydrase/acetyltransferase-like protein (isoleucine patch superfamily)|uniref:Transferase, hexapeptide repeat family protein n=1 Tax=Aneurinibacillus danicus TaxID=267746 RepID=A0A511VDY5_9BACL|nr:MULTISPECIES: gamma carbonic anhydrase family protein [Aneurinibacillus]GEN35482.1 transferase, hexapeptide repeat family protein [Aneurinibacillus danicus]
MNVIEYNGKRPVIADGVFIAPTAVIIGDVTIEEGSSIWFGAVLRGDFGSIHVGKHTSIQDNCVVHVTNEGTYIGDHNTIGHGAIIHSCRIGNRNVIGMNAVILDGAVIEDECMVAAGSVVSNNMVIPGRHLAAGVPAKVKKELEGQSLWWVQESSKEYSKLLESYEEIYLYKK